MMIFKIISLGWKNIWRNPTRSGVVIIAVLLGVWAGVFISAFMNSIAQGYLHNQLNLSVGHIQITHPDFEDQFNPKYDLGNFETLLSDLKQKEYISDFSYESLATGLAQSAVNNYGVTIHGIDTAASNSLTVSEYMVHGNFLSNNDSRSNPIAIGSALANRLEIEQGSKIVLSFQDVEGNITGGAFRVVGIFDSFNENYDKSNVFILRDDLNQLLAKEGLVHKITLKLHDFTTANQHTQSLIKQYPDLKIASWGTIAPELEYVFTSMDITLYIIMIIIVIALVFSIINTMLMAVLERTRELGMLMAVGMNKPRLFGMILSETFFLTMVGTPIGLGLSWFTITFFGNTGIDLSAFAAGLNAYGLDTVVYPELSGTYYLNIALLIAVAAFVSALYPAWKTLKLKPVEAIHKL